MEVIETFGPKFIALLVLAALAWFVLTLAPVIWPAYRAFRNKTALPRPWLFTAVVAALTYGVLYLGLFVLFVPAEAYAVFIAPQLEAMGPYGRSLVRGTQFVANYWWLMLPPVQLAVTVVLTRRLASKWAGICFALAA